MLIAGVQVPVILLVDELGKVKESPEQYGPCALKVGKTDVTIEIVTWSFTEGQGPFAVKVSVIDPEVIEGVYVEVKLDAILNVPDAAVQVALVAEPPIIPFRLTLPPTQIVALFPASTAGVSFTVTVIVVVVAHCPAVGVNVYVVVAKLLMEGAHVPVIPFNEVLGNVIDPPEQIGEIWVKVGVVGALTLIIT